MTDYGKPNQYFMVYMVFELSELYYPTEYMAVNGVIMKFKSKDFF